MYENHRLVFKSHAKKLFLQSFTILITLLIVFTQSYTNVLFSSCILNEGYQDFEYFDPKVNG